MPERFTREKTMPLAAPAIPPIRVPRLAGGLLLALCLSLSLAAAPAEAKKKRDKPAAVKIKKGQPTGSGETRAERDRRLTRECKGRPNAGACLGYAS
jgi:hypothetical protein